MKDIRRSGSAFKACFACRKPLNSGVVFATKYFALRYVLIIASPAQDGAKHAIDRRDPSEFPLIQTPQGSLQICPVLKGEKVKSDGTCRFR